uniref:Large ribosomal subunit protein uL5c n=1 Tax=Dichotomosiphon tuberosus TaxID=118263 RepID=A0A386AWY6_9CHLO|nr:ribosomal protein L5 [Dichotomosiphon tuberosus]
MIQRLYKHYFEIIIPRLLSNKEFNYKHIYKIPKIEKIVINCGIGEASQNPKVLDLSLNELNLIVGQQGYITKAKKAIAGFKIRKNMPIGISVTLRKNFMYGFLDRLINLALPRIRDFPGLNIKSFDGNGNYNIGLEEQLIFPEIKYDKIHKICGMDISIVTTAKTDKESFYLLQAFGMPFQKNSFK